MTIAATISVRQIKAIHALIHQIGLDDDTYRMMLRERCGVTTCKALSHARAALLIDELKVKAGQRPASPPPISPAQPVTARRAHRWPQQAEGRRLKAAGGTITEKQQRLIDALCTQLGWDQRRRDGFCLKIIGRYWPQNNGDVDRLLQVLRPMAARYGNAGYDRIQKNA